MLIFAAFPSDYRRLGISFKITIQTGTQKTKACRLRPAARRAWFLHRKGGGATSISTKITKQKMENCGRGSALPSNQQEKYRKVL